MSEDSLLPFELPSVARKKLSVGFDGGQLSSDAGVLVLRGVEKKLGLAARLASCIRDRRKPERIETSEAMLRLRDVFALRCRHGMNDDEQKTTYKDLTGEPFDMPGGALAFGGGFGGGGGFGQPGGGGFGGGFGGFGGGGQPGTVLTTNVQDQLKLTEEQKKELEAIQKDVDAKLEKMLTEEQRKQLKDLRDRQPGRGGRQPKKDN